ncbi:MAG: Unknown protein [uncultured Sulfurovum sp.]|uniref:Uncharacterized protein n=1 Tax=uncultured Sulfurovum sp. TaxID=269237 RepID=A0A6S6T5V7_9BACT|nr:MAG: Unknown protein [uncultured Sulfurovum sp.]
MKKCENFINEIVNFIKSNPVDDFEMTEKDTLYYIDWICDDNEYEEGEKKIYDEKYVKFSFGHSSSNPDLLRYDTFEELEESLIDMMGNMFCSYNFPIINGKVPSYTMLCEENGEWKVCHHNTLIHGERKNKKIIWEL